MVVTKLVMLIDNLKPTQIDQIIVKVEVVLHRMLLGEIPLIRKVIMTMDNLNPTQLDRVLDQTFLNRIDKIKVMNMIRQMKMMKVTKVIKMNRI